MTKAQRQRVLDAIPTSWLDPILTGPTAVVGPGPWGRPEVEAILRAVRQRLDERMPLPESPRRAKR